MTNFFSTVIIFSWILACITSSEHLLYTESGIINIPPEKAPEMNSNLFRRLLKNDDENLPPRRLLTRNYLQDIDKQAILDSHNLYRTKTASMQTPNQPAASDMNEMFWDPALAKVAEDYTRKCIFDHNANRSIDLKALSNMASWELESSVSVGENLYLTTGAESLDGLLAGMDAFYGEYQYYTYSTNQCQSGKTCGHYKQLVTARSRYVGCGYTFCPSVYYPAANRYYSNAILFACDYSPPSNSVPYTEGNACSKCSNDRQCKNGAVCGGCPNEYYSFCSDTSTLCSRDILMCPTDCTFDSTNVLCAQCRTTCKTCENENVNGESKSLSCSNGISSYSFGNGTPTSQTTLKPTPQPTSNPTSQPTLKPTLRPTLNPTFQPTLKPTSQPTLKPTAQPTLKPSLTPTQSPTYQDGINQNFCCHAHSPNDYEQRCNLLTDENACSYTYDSICYWQPSDKCLAPLTTKVDTQYYCTSLSSGTRKKASCKTFSNEVECQYNGCKWSAVTQ